MKEIVLSNLVYPDVLKNWGEAVGVKEKFPCLAIKGEHGEKLEGCGDRLN